MPFLISRSINGPLSWAKTGAMKTSAPPTRASQEDFLNNIGRFIGGIRLKEPHDPRLRLLRTRDARVTKRQKAKDSHRVNPPRSALARASPLSPNVSFQNAAVALRRGCLLLFFHQHEQQ